MIVPMVGITRKEKQLAQPYVTNEQIYFVDPYTWELASKPFENGCEFVCGGAYFYFIVM